MPRDFQAVGATFGSPEVPEIAPGGLHHDATPLGRPQMLDCLLACLLACSNNSGSLESIFGGQ